MKVLKISSLILMSLILVNCDNSKKASNESASTDASQSSSSDYNASQDLVINEVKKQLPLTVDPLTTLVDVSKENNAINYKYNIKGTPKDTLLLPDSQKAIFDNLKKAYCVDNQQVKALKSFFPNGAKHDYYIDDEKVVSLELTPTTCDAN